MEPTVSSETSAIRTQTPGNNPKGTNYITEDRSEPFPTIFTNLCPTCCNPNLPLFNSGHKVILRTKNVARGHLPPCLPKLGLCDQAIVLLSLSARVWIVTWWLNRTDDAGRHVQINDLRTRRQSVVALGRGEMPFYTCSVSIAADNRTAA